MTVDLYADTPAPVPARKRRTPVQQRRLEMALERERKRFDDVRQHCDITHCYGGLAGSWIGDERGGEAANYQKALIEDEARAANYWIRDSLFATMSRFGEDPLVLDDVGTRS